MLGGRLGQRQRAARLSWHRCVRRHHGRLTIHAKFTQIGKVVNGKCNLTMETAGNGVVMGVGYVSYGSGL